MFRKLKLVLAIAAFLFSDVAGAHAISDISSHFSAPDIVSNTLGAAFCFFYLLLAPSIMLKEDRDSMCHDEYERGRQSGYEKGSEDGFLRGYGSGARSNGTYTQKDLDAHGQKRADAVFKELFAGQTNPCTGKPIECEADYRQYQHWAKVTSEPRVFFKEDQ